MSLTHWDPFRELEDISNRLNRTFGRSALQRTQGSRDALTFADWVPSVDVAETAEDFQIKVELPEVKREDIKVQVDNGVLRIEGERRQEKEEKGKKYHRVERSYGSFLRSFTLPENVQGERVAAEFKDGVLQVRLPKSQQSKPKALEVKVG